MKIERKLILTVPEAWKLKRIAENVMRVDHVNHFRAGLYVSKMLGQIISNSIPAVCRDISVVRVEILLNQKRIEDISVVVYVQKYKLKKDAKFSQRIRELLYDG